MDQITLPKYNGWPNKPTWALALWLGQDQGTYEYAHEHAQTESLELWRERIEEWFWWPLTHGDELEASCLMDAGDFWLSLVDWDHLYKTFKERT